jgi:hypothetical protein
MSAKAQSLLASAVNDVGNAGPLFQLLSFLAAQSGGALTATPLPRVLFVSNLAVVAGANGSIVAPYATIAAAMAVLVDGGTIVIAPGTYAEAVVVPAARRNVSIIGYGTVTIAATAGISLSYLPTGAYSAANPPRLYLENLIIGGAAAGLTVNGSGLASVGASVVLNNVNDVSLTGSELRFCDSIEAHGGTFTAPVAIAASRQAFLNDAVFSAGAGGGLTLDYDAANAGIVATHSGYNLNGCTVSLITHANEATVACNKSVTVINYAVSSLSATAAFSYNINFQGRITGTMALGTLPNTNGLTQPTINLQSSTIAALTVVSDDATAGGRTILAQGSSILSVTSNGGDATVALNVRGGLRPPTLTFGANFRLNRDQIAIRNVTFPNAATPFTFGAGVFAAEPAFPTGVTYSVAYGQRLVVAAVGSIPFTTLDTVAGFTATSTGTDADVTITAVA